MYSEMISKYFERSINMSPFTFVRSRYLNIVIVRRLGVATSLYLIESNLIFKNNDLYIFK